MCCTKVKTTIKFKNILLKNCYYTNKLLTKLLYLKTYSTNQIDFMEIFKAIFFAKKYHKNQFRQSGEPYYSHPLEVAYIVSNYLFKTEAIIVSILHDTIEDTVVTKKMLEINFGSSIANQVEYLTRIKDGRKITSEQIIESLYNQKKYDLLVIKLIDRLHNLQTIHIKTTNKIKETVIETLTTKQLQLLYNGMF